jgi:ABC-type amino acid transport substrate-binding protein
MTHRARDLALLPERADELGVVRVAGEVEHGPVAADVEDGVVGVDVDLGQLLCGREFLLDGLVLEELYGIWVVFEGLREGGEVERR